MSKSRWVFALTLFLCACSGGGSGPDVQAPSAPTLALFAGAMGGTGNVDGVGTAARFSGASGLALDAAGSVYVVDRNNRTVRKITATGEVTTFAGSPGQDAVITDGIGTAASFRDPVDVAVDSLGNLYVADNNVVRKITPAGVVSTWAGNVAVIGATDGTGTAATFQTPVGVTVDRFGNVYVVDPWNVTVRKITAAGVVSTIAGVTGERGSADGVGSAARFQSPAAVTADPDGNLYVADGNSVRKVTPSGLVSTLVGSSGAVSVAADSQGNVYVLESSNPGALQQDVRKVAPSGEVSTVVHGVGPTARRLTIGPGGKLYVSYVEGVRIVDASGMVTLLAGPDDSTGFVDGQGAQARFGGAVTSLAVDRAGNVYAADVVNNAIRIITPQGSVSTRAVNVVAGSESIISVAVDGGANLYVGSATCPRGFCSGTIRKIDPAGTVSFVRAATSSDGTPIFIVFPAGLAIDRGGNLLVADLGGVARIDASGNITTVAKATPGFGAAGVAVDGSGNTYAVFASGEVRKVTTSGTPSILAAGSSTYGSLPRGITVSDEGDVYVADSVNSTIVKIAAAGNATTIAGVAGKQGFVPGPLPGVLDSVRGLAVSGTNLYVSTTNGVAVIRNRP